jgi:hypothetical protein
VGSASTKVSSILSLLPPSEARPACISTTMASTTWRRRAGGVAQPSSNSLSSATARRQRDRADALRATSAAAIAQVAAAQPAASPSPLVLRPRNGGGRQRTRGGEPSGYQRHGRWPWEAAGSGGGLADLRRRLAKEEARREAGGWGPRQGEGGGCGWGHGEEGAAAGLGGNELGFGMRLLIYFANAITVVESAMDGWK